MKNGWIIDKKGVKRHYVDGKLHSINDEPSYTDNIHKMWHYKGKLHRVNNPAIIGANYKLWYLYGVLDRRDGGPAAIYEYQSPCKIEYWYYRGKLHRLDGPAVITCGSNGSIDSRYYLLDIEVDKNRLKSTIIDYMLQGKIKKSVAFTELL